MEQDRAKVRQLFQEMPFKEKCRYLWSEFRWHFLAVVIAAAVLITTVAGLINKKEPVLWGVAINHSLSSPDAVLQQWEAALELDDNSCISFYDGVSIILDEVTDPQALSYGSAYQIICAAAVNELDFVITDEAGLMFLYGDNICRDIREVLDEPLLVIYAPYLYTPEELNIPIARDLSGTPMAQKLGLNGQEVYLALPNLSGNDAVLLSFLHYLSES